MNKINNHIGKACELKGLPIRIYGEAKHTFLSRPVILYDFMFEDPCISNMILLFNKKSKKRNFRI